MARPRDSRRDKAKQIWLGSKGEIKLVDLAEQFEVTSSTIRKWKATDKWDTELKGSAPKPKRSAPNRSRGQPGAPIGNKNALGNEGGAPKKNQNAVTHGFFAKFLPTETLEIIEGMQERSPADLIYDQIEIQYAAIIRAQRIMFVTDKDEMIKELKKAKYEYYPVPEEEGGGVEQAVTEEEYEFQFAWDRHATFLNAQSRAMSELRSLIKQFNDMATEDDERRLRLEQMQLNVNKTKAEIDKLGSKEQQIRVIIEDDVHE